MNSSFIARNFRGRNNRGSIGSDHEPLADPGTTLGSKEDHGFLNEELVRELE
jgi:hypothetical protein